MNHSYRVCTRCVMDTSVPDISFDADGVCNYCTKFVSHGRKILDEDPATRSKRLEALVSRIKNDGQGKPYDCIVGVSGGVDSSWVLVKAIELGLRPLAVHMDNGWNSELAQNNIANLVRGLGVDLYTHVIDWVEYKNLMQAFFDADVLDVELLYDNAMLAINYRMAGKYGIKYILSGSNTATEGMSLPKNWSWLKNDARNIRAIGARRGVSIKTFPAIGTLQFLWYRMVKGVSWLSLLDLIDYNKEAALQKLEDQYGYKRYPYKHYESIFTRFYQGYILPEKFKIDKRRVHLSTLVMTGQMSRAEALKHFESIPYHSTDELNEDLKYFLKKMGWKRGDLDAYLKRPEISHDHYPSEKWLWDAAVSARDTLVRGGLAKR